MRLFYGFEFGNVISLARGRKVNFKTFHIICASRGREFSQSTSTTPNEATPDPANPLQAIPNPNPAANDPNKGAEEDKQKAVPKKRRQKSMDRNFITSSRAREDFLLNPLHLDSLRKTVRRSPHANEPPIVVHWRRDVINKAVSVWGSMTEIEKEKQRRESNPIEIQEAESSYKSILKRYEKATSHWDINDNLSSLSNLMTGSGRIVVTAVLINGMNFVIKLGAWFITGSHSMFAEAIHSMADTINQCILAYGIHKSTQRANVDHPYGYSNMRHVASLISGVGIFCVGSGLSIYHGIIGLLHPDQVESFYWAFFILGGSLVSEGATLLMATSAVKKRAKEANITFKEFIIRGRDPSLNVVLLEDTAAVTGVGICAICMGLTAVVGSPIPDAIGSLVIGGLLGGVASFIIYSNSAALVGRSIPRKSIEKINEKLEQDVMIRAVHDVKGIDMGNLLVRYKAEVDFDGRELTRSYLDKQNLAALLNEVKNLKTEEEMENFMLNHGENIVDTLGAEIDRIETFLKREHPEIRHCDLEIL